MLKREILQLETFGVTPRKWAPSSFRGMSNPTFKKERLNLRFKLLVFTLQLTIQLLGSRKQGWGGGGGTGWQQLPRASLQTGRRREDQPITWLTIQPSSCSPGSQCPGGNVLLRYL